MSHIKLDAKVEALAAMSPAQLRAEWNALSGEDLANAPASLIRYLIAYRLQEKHYRKLPAQIERQLDRLAGGRGLGGGAADKAARSAESCKPIPKEPTSSANGMVRPSP
ncbi:MAG: DUF2924 domain-containing protein [Sphingorhabdus sp.]